MRSQQRSTTVAERLRLKSGELTVAERKLMAALFANYPVAGLGSITEFAREAAVSTPSGCAPRSPPSAASWRAPSGAWTTCERGASTSSWSRV